MGAKLDQLRAARIAHKKHQFSSQEVDLIESLTDEEVRTLIKVRDRLGEKLLRKKDPKEGPHPDTLLL